MFVSYRVIPDSLAENDCIAAAFETEGIIEEWYRGSNLSSLWSSDRMRWRIFLCLKVQEFQDTHVQDTHVTTGGK